MRTSRKKSAFEPDQPPLARDPRGSVKTVLIDYYHFLTLVAFLVLVWPVAAGAHRVDRLFRTRSVERIIRFCEWF